MSSKQHCMTLNEMSLALNIMVEMKDFSRKWVLSLGIINHDLRGYMISLSRRITWCDDFSCTRGLNQIEKNHFGSLKSLKFSESNNPIECYK